MRGHGRVSEGFCLDEKVLHFIAIAPHIRQNVAKECFIMSTEKGCSNFYLFQSQITDFSGCGAVG